MMKTQEVTGYIKPKFNGTKLRKDFSTYSEDIGSYPAGVIVTIDQVIERTETDALKVNNYKGDIWGRVTSINGNPVSGYMAIVYHNTSTFAPVVICDSNYTVKTQEPSPVEATVFPDFIMVFGTDGEKTVEVKYIPE